jgi:hypothetical protein
MEEFINMRVIQATYGPLDVTNVINDNYINDDVISFSASNDVFGDPMPGGVKQLIISIEDDGIKNYTHTEGEHFIYPTSKEEEDRKTLLRNLNRLQLIKLYDIKGLGIEVGVQSGYFSKEILDSTTDFHLIALDSWRTIEEGYREGGNVDIENHIKNLTNTLNILTADHDGRFTIMRELCEVACHFFKDELFDFIYLDANHSEAFVSEELKRWYPKLKPGGLIAGHDYVTRPGDQAFGVKDAVDKFFKEKNLKFEVCDFGCCPTWFHIKQ